MVYLNEIRNGLIASSSERDVSLYEFLHGRKHSIRSAPSDIEGELCSKALVGENGREALEKLRKIKPFKGFHYSNNLVLLVSAAISDMDGEEDNVKNYLASHGHKDQLIINHALGKNYQIAKSTGVTIDILSRKIERNEVLVEADIKSGISSIVDLYDLYVVESAIAKSVLQSNEIAKIPSYKLLVTMQHKALQRLEKLSFVFLGLIALYGLYLVTPALTNKIVKHWDVLEPLTYILDKVILFVVLVSGVVFTSIVKSTKKYIKNVVLTVLYSILGLNYSRYKELDKLD